MKSRTTNTLTTLLRPIGVGLCVGVVTATLLLLVCALLIYKMDLPLGATTPLALVAIGIGGLLGGGAVGLSAKQQGLLLGAVCGTLMYLILLIAGLARGDIAPGYAAIKWAVLAVCSAAGSVWGVNRR